MLITTVLVAPSRSAAPSTFSDDFDTFLGDLPAWTGEANALEVNVNAKEASAVAAAAAALVSQGNAATSAAQAALSAGATAWVSGLTYAIGDRRTSPLTGRLFRRRTAGAGTTDPSSDPTNWAPVQIAAPLQVVTGLTQLAVAGAAYNMVNVIAQPAATNIVPYSKRWDLWTQTGTGSLTQNALMGCDGDLSLALLSDTDATVAAANFARAMTIPNDSASWTASAKFKAGTAADTVLMLHMPGGTTAQGQITITWGATPTVVASGGTAQPLVYLGNGIYRTGITVANNSSGNVTANFVIYPASNFPGLTGSVYVEDPQLELGTVMTSTITTTGATSVTRPSGVVEPSRFILPASPSENDQAEVMFTNGIDTNIVDPNGATVHGGTGPIRISRVSSKGLVWVFINGTWELRA